MSHKPQTAWCVVPAAGVGARLGGAVPKQYRELGGCTILARSVQAFARSPDIAGVVVGIADGDVWWPRLGPSRENGVHAFTGGATRAQTVLNGLEYLLKILGAGQDDWVLVHDAARPLVPAEDIQRLLASCRATGSGAILAAAMVDTVKRADPAGQVVATEDRNVLWRALTPQCFPLGILADAVRAAMDRGVESTDESAAMEMAGYSVRIVEGSSRNIKITVSADLELAHCLLET